MVAMVLTAISYGRMAALYPSAGSAYTYVGRGLHPYLGFVSGWAMLLDYVVSPLFCVIYGSLALQRAVPALPYPVCAALFAGGITYLNLRGIRSTARANQVLLTLHVCGSAELHRARDPVSACAARRGRLVFDQAVLRSGNIQCARYRGRHVVRGADVSRLRCRDHAGRGREESAPQRDAGRGWRCAHSPEYSAACWSTSASSCGRITTPFRTSRRRSSKSPAASAESWLFQAMAIVLVVANIGAGHDHAGGRRAAAVRHGARQRDSPAVFRPPSSGAQHAQSQHLADRDSGLSRARW